MTPDSGSPKRPLAKESGFWRRLDERGAVGKTDILRLRDELARLEELTRGIGSGRSCCEDVAHEVHRIRESVTKDYGTQMLVLQTLIELMIDKGNMSEDEFADKLDEIDMRDGIRDGMLHPGGSAPSSGGAS